MNTSTRDKYDLKHYTRLIISFFGGLLVLTIYQYTALYIKGVVDIIFGTSFLIAAVHQIGYACLVGLILVFPFNFWENLRPRYGFVITALLLALLLLIEAVLVGYFCTALVPLGSDLLGYGFEDVKTAVGTSGGPYFALFLGGAVVLALFWGFYRLSSKYYHHINRMYPFTIILVSMFIMTLFIEGKPINHNKTQYLVLNIYDSATEDTSYDPKVEFPLVKKEKPENVLGPYFDLKEERPNIVFIVVEGLGRDFVGEGAEYGGFTPFLDDLTTKSLYWENCLSNTGRSFGALPSLLGSLPFGKSGFMELEQYPNKLTLLGILKSNGYHTSFYRGSHSALDHVDRFLNSEQVDFVLDKSGFGPEYTLQVEDEAGFSWGYPDKELFKKSMELPRDPKRPRMEVYMTFSTHEPFVPPRPEVYEGQVEKILAKGIHRERTQKTIEKHKNVFATLLYADDALRYVFEAYKKRADYENTLFIVTGSHRLASIPQRNNLSPFHVPLMIFSPMLKAPRKMGAINSHFDVTPSLLALLEGKYPLKTPPKVAWMGSGLDMDIAFRGTKDIPLMRNKNELKEYLSGEELYTDGQVFRIDAKMGLHNGFGVGDLEAKLKAFKSMNAYVTANDKIIPDSLALFGDRKEEFSDSEIVYINSVYNGENFDKVYLKARRLALEKEYDKALLLCRYILSESPSHIDTKVLMGRANVWRGDDATAVKILKECIAMNPNYIDSYAALFDVYYWSGRTKEALELIELAKRNSSSVDEIADKIERAKRQAQKKGMAIVNDPDTNLALSKN